MIANSSSWHQLFSTLTLPLLFSFELIAGDQLVEGKNVDLRDVEGFLTRHPSILILNISIPDLVPPFQKPILPRLCYIQMLEAVTITTEPGDFDC